MSGRSRKSKVVQVRLPNDIIEIIEGRIAKQVRFTTVAKYLSNHIIWEVTRKHTKRA